MPMWAFLLYLFAGFMVFGIVYDLTINKKRRSERLSESVKHEGPANIVYKEQFLDEQRNHIHDRFP